MRSTVSVRGAVLVSLVFAFAASLRLGAATQRVRLELRLAGGSDDVEESEEGAVDTASSDLELVTDGARGAQIVGLRFASVPLASDAVVRAAYIQLTAEEADSSETRLSIAVEATDDAPPFREQRDDLGARATTAQSVAWAPPPWTRAGAAGAAQRTPDLAPLVRAVLARPGWRAGNALAILVRGSGRRTAVAFDADPRAAPVLVVEAEVPVRDSGGSPLVINEVSAGYHTLADRRGDHDDWVELYNASGSPVRLAGYFLSDSLDDLTRWPLPSDLEVPARGHLLLWTDGEPDEGADHGPFKLKSSGDDLALVRSRDGALAIVDYVQLPDMALRASHGRERDGEGMFIPFGIATPGEENDPSGAWLEPPAFSLASGFYPGRQTLTLSTRASGAVIRYTTDGSEPRTSSRRYDEPLSIRDSQSVRARVYKDGFAPSWVATRVYLIDEVPELPVVFIAMDPDDLWGDDEGIYVAGTNGIAGNCDTEPRNWNQPWERSAHITYLELDGSVGFATDVGISITGGCTRRKPQKSLNVATRSRLGSTDIDYRLFPTREQTKFKRFKLRNSGNDRTSTMLRDAYLQRLVEGEVDLELQSYRPVVVYLNEDYWGIHNIRDLYSEHYLNEKFPDVETDNVDLLAEWRNPDAIEGDTDAFDELFEFVEESDFSDEEDYRYVESQVDLSQLINYYILEIFVGNHDWPGNNVKMWRERKDGARWRWLVFDLDNAFGKGRESEPSYDTLDYALADDGPNWPNGPDSTLFHRRLLENEEFRDEFIQRFATQLDLVFTAARLEDILEELAAVVEDEMPHHVARWRDEEGISSMSRWRSELDDMLEYGIERPRHVRDHIDVQFGLRGTYRLTLRHDAASGGRVYLNRDERLAPFDHRGTYFRRVPLRLRAEPAPGFRFVRWRELDDDRLTIDATFDGDTILTPVFEPAGEEGGFAPSSSELVVSEIHYHPVDSEDYEFIELLNVSDRSLDLFGLRIGGGVDFVFPRGPALPPGGFVLVVEDEEAFDVRYRDPDSAAYFFGIAVAGAWQGALDNGGEEITVSTWDGELVSRVRYDDAGEWPAAADGDGPSLELGDPFAAPPAGPARDVYLGSGSNWRASGTTHGTPGRLSDPGGVRIRVLPVPARSGIGNGNGNGKVLRR